MRLTSNISNLKNLSFFNACSDVPQRFHVQAPGPRSALGLRTRREEMSLKTFQKKQNNKSAQECFGCWCQTELRRSLTSRRLAAERRRCQSSAIARVLAAVASQHQTLSCQHPSQTVSQQDRSSPREIPKNHTCRYCDVHVQSRGGTIIKPSRYNTKAETVQCGQSRTI